VSSFRPGREPLWGRLGDDQQNCHVRDRRKAAVLRVRWHGHTSPAVRTVGPRLASLSASRKWLARTRYATNEHWYNVAAEQPVPSWPPLAQMHPCDLQASMKRGCTPGKADPQAYAAFYSEVPPSPRYSPSVSLP
jgi:hypothetical protein